MEVHKFIDKDYLEKLTDLKVVGIVKSNKNYVTFLLENGVHFSFKKW